MAERWPGTGQALGPTSTAKMNDCDHPRGGQRRKDTSLLMTRVHRVQRVLSSSAENTVQDHVATSQGPPHGTAVSAPLQLAARIRGDRGSGTRRWLRK